MIGHLIYAGLGFVAGAFCPSVMRAIKAQFVKEAAKASPFVNAEVAGAEATLKADAKKVL